MACPPYAPPAGGNITAVLAAGYLPPAANAIVVVLDPCAGGEELQRLYLTTIVPFGRSGRRDARPLTGGWNPAAVLARRARVPWGRGDRRDALQLAAWADLVRVEQGAQSSWNAAAPADHQAVSRWALVLPRDHRTEAPWAAASQRIDARTAGPWARTFARDGYAHAAWNAAQLPALLFQLPGGVPYLPPPGGAIGSVLFDGYAPPPGGDLVVVVVGSGAPPPRIVQRQDPVPELVPWGRVPVRDTETVIPWGPQGSYGGRDPIIELPWIVEPPDPPAQPPSLKVHIVINNVSVVRLPDMTPIEVTGVDVASNIDSWCWSVRMDLADPAQLALLLPDGSGPRIVQITINSYVWTAIIEGRSRSRGFGQSAITVVGRSRTALLDAPYAPRRSSAEDEARTARQLAEVELAGTDFTLAWDGADWLVPGGAWYYNDLTPQAVIADIANAAGAVLQSHPTDTELSLRPRYPVAPWAWQSATADLVLPASWVVDERSQYAAKPMLDAVFVRGEQQGVQARVTRQGSAGETFAEQVVHKLITHTDVARQRGTAALGDRGEQELVDLQIPLFAAGTETAGATGLYLPLNLVEVQDIAATWRGLSVGVSITARRAGRDNRGLDVWQNVSLERHMTDAS